MELARKLGLLTKLIDVVVKGSFYYKDEWKHLINDRCINYDKIHWELTCGLYKGMDLYQEVMPESYTGVWPWWMYCARNVNDIKRCSILLKVVTGDVSCFAQNDPVCKLCQSVCSGLSAKVLHVFECNITEQMRTEKWVDVEMVMPMAMIQDFNQYNSREKVIFIATAMGGYVPEWDAIYHAMLKYVEATWRHIKSLMVNE